MNKPQMYRRRRPLVRAIRWLGESNCKAVFNFLGLEHPEDEMDHSLIHFDSCWFGQETAEPGDWIVAAEGGGHGKYTDAEFRAHFEVDDYETETGHLVTCLAIAMGPDGADPDCCGPNAPVVEPHCDGFPTGCPTKVTVPPAPPHHGGGFRCGCFDDTDMTEEEIDRALAESEEP